MLIFPGRAKFLYEYLFVMHYEDGYTLLFNQSYVETGQTI